MIGCLGVVEVSVKAVCQECEGPVYETRGGLLMCDRCFARNTLDHTVAGLVLRASLGLMKEPLQEAA